MDGPDLPSLFPSQITSILLTRFSRSAQVTPSVGPTLPKALCGLISLKLPGAWSPAVRSHHLPEAPAPPSSRRVVSAPESSPQTQNKLLTVWEASLETHSALHHLCGNTTPH